MPQNNNQGFWKRKPEECQNGYVSRRDLAPVMGTPGDLEIALKGVEPKKTGCA